MPRTPTGYFNQTYAIEFEVTGSLDGTTPSPEILDSPPTGQNPGDPQNLFRLTVENLGIIDPDYLVDQESRLGTRGNRLVSFIWIRGPLGAPDASVDLVDALGSAPVVQKAEGTFSGLTTFYKEAIFIPQGSALRVRGMVGSLGNPIKVRLHVQFLEDAEDLAAAISVTGQRQTLEQVLETGPETDGRNIVLSSGDRIDFQSTFLVNNNMAPNADNVYGNGARDARWAAVISRMSLAVSLVGGGTVEALYGANSVGLLQGSVYAPATGTARIQVGNPAAPSQSSLGVRARARAVAGGLAEAFASGAGSKVSGAVEAFTANNARLRATGIGSEASGYVGALGFDATLEATGIGARASGYAKSYSGPYGTVRLRSTGKGSRAAGAALYFANIYASGHGAVAEGLAYGLGSREAEIFASGLGSRAQGISVGGTLLASGSGAMASGYAKRGDAAFGASIEATGRGSFAFGVANRDPGTDGPAKVSVTNSGSFAFGVAYDASSLVEVQGQGSFACGVAITYGALAVAEIIVGPVGLGNGAWAGGFAGSNPGYTARVSAEEAGAFAMGKCAAITGNTYIRAYMEGSFAHGRAEDASIIATGKGSFAQGEADGNVIEATADGAFAQGSSTDAAIVASAANATQFGPGNNSMVDTMQVGAAGLAFKGSVGVPPVLQDGIFWVTVGGDVYCRTGGISKKLTNIT